MIDLPPGSRQLRIRGLLLIVAHHVELRSVKLQRTASYQVSVRRIITEALDVSAAYSFDLLPEHARMCDE